MDNPATLTDGDHNSIAGYRQSFPYFVPARYLEALEKHKAAPFAPAMMSAVMPYMGDWMLFCDFMNVGAGKMGVTNIAAKAVEAAPAKAEPAAKNAFSQGRTQETKPAPQPPTASPQPEPVKPAEAVAPVEDKKEQATTAAVQQQAAQPEAAPQEVNATSSAKPQEAKAEPALGAAEATVAAVAEKQTEEPVAEAVPDVPQAAPEVADEQPAAPVAAARIEEQPEQPEIVPPVQPDKKTELMNEGEAIGAAGEGLSDEELESRHKNFWIQGEEEEMEWPEEGAGATGEEGILEDLATTSPLKDERPLIHPIYTEDYFLQQGEKVSTELPDEIDSLLPEDNSDEGAKSLMVMMSFSEWLLHFKSTAEKQQEDDKGQKALKTMWQKEKLAAAIEEENEEIPENVFEMAVNSITKEDGLASESLAEIYIKQGKYDKAIDMYRKLSLRNPQKSAYFARKIEDILKERES